MMRVGKTNKKNKRNKKMKWWLILLGIVGAFGLALIVIVSSLIGQFNDAAKLRNQYEAKVVDNSSEFDNMKKKISQVVQVSDVQYDKLKEILVSYADARSTKSDNVMMNWIKESVPNIDTSTYKTIINIITGSRDSWTMRQKELIDISREYNQRLSVFPGNFILPMFGFQKIVPKVITSSATEKAFETGKDDDVKIH